jgi:hypothetical protein
MRHYPRPAPSLPPADADAFAVSPPAVRGANGAQISVMKTTKPPVDESAAQKKPNASADRPKSPSPPERHPGQKPEDAEGSVEDLKIRESGNQR